MPSSISSISNTRAGLCPHGLPPSACPICSGGGGMGGARAKETVVTKPTNSGEWSYMKCYAAGLAMRAQEARVENAKTAFERQIEFAQKLSQNIQNIADKIKAAVENIKNTMPNLIANTVQFLTKVFVMPVLSLIAQIPKIIEKFANFQQNLANMLQQAGEKLTAFLGDIKNFIEKKLFENTKKTIKKFFSFFVKNTEDENYKDDEALAVFKSREIKKFVVNFFTRIKKRNDDEDRPN